MKRRIASILFTAAAAATAIGLTAGTSLAQTTLTAVYPVTGSTHVKAPNSTLSLGPGTLTSTITLGTPPLPVTGSISLPPATGSFNVIGIVPVTATVEFIPVGPTTGTITGAVTDGTVTATSHITIRITHLIVGGLNVPPGPACQTIVPATITVTSPPDFNAVLGGTLTGTYTLPLFNNCGLLDAEAPLIDSVLPGPGNTISLTLGTPTIS